MHTIRLRGPWHQEPLLRFTRSDDGLAQPATDNLPPDCRVDMPCDWSTTLGPNFRGRVKYRRHFNCPTGVTADDRIYLVIRQVDASADVWLNDQQIGHIEGHDLPGRFPIARCLQPHTELVVVVTLSMDDPPDARPPGRDGLAGGLTGEVVLEIDDTPTT